MKFVSVAIFSFGSLLWASYQGPEFANCNTLLGSLGQKGSTKDYAVLQLHKPKSPQIVSINYKLLRQDIPILKYKTDSEVYQWVLDNLSHVSKYVNDNAGIQHSGVNLDLSESRNSRVPHTYGRADVIGEEAFAVDRKGIGVTYVGKDKEGQIVLKPGTVQFKAGADHQNGLAKIGEGIYEQTAGEILQLVTGEKEDRIGANEVYGIVDIGTRLFDYDGAGNVSNQNPAGSILRQPNVRFYRLSKEEAALGRDSFLYNNAKLFWTGIYHGSMNRYNADKGVYLDYGTVTGVPQRSYRLTTMTHVPYGLSDFYGLFGEWSQGQAAGKGTENESPFYDRSWSLFLANLGMAAGMEKSKLLEFVNRNQGDMGSPDLHESLLKLNERRNPEFRLDPTKKTFTKMDLIKITETGESGAEPTENLTDSVAFYRALLSRAGKKSGDASNFYKNLIRKASLDPEEAAIKDLALQFTHLESILEREGLSVEAENVGKDRIGEQLLRRRIWTDAFETEAAYEREKNENPANRNIERYRKRIQAAELIGGSPAEKLSNLAEKLARSGLQPAARIRIKTDSVERELPFLLPTAQTLESKEYQDLRESTLGLIWRDTRPAGEQFGHSYVRIGDRIYDLQVAKIFGDDFSRMMQGRLFHNFSMKDHGGNSPYQEVLFAISPESKDELIKFYEARMQGKATVDGKVTVPHFDVSGKNEAWQDGIIRENCGAFGTCFNHPRWWKNYPLLEHAAKETGIIHGKDGATVALDAFFDLNTKPLAVMSWGPVDRLGDPAKVHEILGFQKVGYKAEVLQTWKQEASEPLYQNQADEMRNWAESKGLWGVQATSFPTSPKEGQIRAKAERLNIIRLDNSSATESYAKEIAPKSFTLWWRWEPNGQYGHSWVSIGDQIYDQSAGGYSKEALSDFIKREKAKDFDLNGTKTFFVGVQVEMQPQELKALQNFYNSRVQGAKVDGTVLPKPSYRWDAGFVKDEISEGRCGMFATSCANAAWQKLFPELPLGEISEKYNIKYADGSLFLLHRAVKQMKGPKNIFYMGADEHMKTKDVNWALPTDSLPQNVRESSKAAWVVGDRQAFGK